MAPAQAPAGDVAGRGSVGRGSVVCEGELGVQKEEGLSSCHYCVLTEGLFEYFVDQEAHAARQAAAGRVDCRSIVAAERIPGGLELCLQGGQRLPLSLGLGLVDGDTESWVQAFQSLGVEIRGRDAAITKRIHEGEVQHVQNGEMQKATLYEDRIEFSGSSSSSWKQLTLKSVRGVKVEESIVTISLDKRDVAFKAARGTAQVWGQVLNGAMSQLAASRTSTRSSRRNSGPPPQEDSREDAEGVLYEGELELCLKQGGSGGRYHFVLYQDRLQYYKSPAAVKQAQPEKVFILEEIEDLEVEDTHFVVHMCDGSEYVFKETSPSALDGWVDAFGQVLETDEQIDGARRSSFQTSTDLADGPTRCVYEGTLDLVVGPGELEPRHVVLYGDKIDFFESQEDSDRGCVPLDTVMNADVRSVRVQEDALLVGLDDQELHLQLPKGADIEAWINALKGVMDPEADDVGPSEITQGPWPWSAASTPSTAATASAFNQRARLPDSPIAREMADPRVAAWLNSTCEEVIWYHGVLWLQEDRKLVPRFCVLFGDRIDWWASPLQAASHPDRRMQPEGRIVLSEVRGLAVVGSGFVLNYRGRKMGIHVGDLVELQEWSRALLSVLEPGAARAPSPPRSPAGSRAPASPGVISAGQSPRASARSWVPRVATLPSPAAARAARLAENGASPTGSAASRNQGGYPVGRANPQRHVGMTHRSSATGRAALARKQGCRRDPSDPAGVGAAAAYFNARKEFSDNKDRATSPRNPLEREHFATKQGLSQKVANKVNTRAENSHEIMQAAQRRHENVADKVSYPRAMSPRSAPVAEKITGASSAGASGVSRRSRPGNVSPKPHEADRVPLRSPRCGASGNTGLAGKITGSPAARSPRTSVTSKFTDRAVL